MKPVLNQVKVEDGFEQLEVVGDGIDDGDLERTVFKLPEFGKVKLVLGHIRNKAETYIGQVGGFVLRDVFRDLVDLVGDVLRSWTSVGGVELDTEIIVWSTRVVRGCEEDTSVGLE